MPLVETRGLSKQYGGTTALRDVNLKVERGEFLALVGPSGSGKTTLLRLLDLLEDPSSGRILFDGVETSGGEGGRLALRRRIGIVFQQSVMFDASVYDNVAYPLRVRGVKKGVSNRVRDALTLVEMEGFEGRRGGSLSGGEMQRVSLAQALIAEPELLLLDEPTANLDPRNASLIENAISTVNRERGVTVIMASHNMLQVNHLAKKAAILREGRLLQVGLVEEVFTQPSDFLAGFARLQNVFSGKATPVEDGLARVDLGKGVVVEAATWRRGEVTVYIRPEEIFVSNKSFKSSARNLLPGRVTAVSDHSRGVQVSVDVGQEFSTVITRRSHEEMRVTVGSRVYLGFKASSVHVL